MTHAQQVTDTGTHFTGLHRQPEAPVPATAEWHHPRWRRLTAEAVGTFLLVLVAAAGGVAMTLSHGAVGHPASAIAPGAMVLALVYSLGETSGAHLDPAVTLAFAARGDFPRRRVPGYPLAQPAGATAAAGDHRPSLSGRPDLPARQGA